MKFNTQSSLPDLWVWTTLRDVGDIYSGGTPSTKNSSYFEGDIPWITPADLSGYENMYISKGKRNISREAINSSSAVLIPAGSVLFSSRAPIGYVAIAKNEVTTNQGFKSIKPLGGISSEYIFYYLKTIKDLAEAEASGTTFLEISKSKFERLPVPLAPRPEQQRIVDKIEELFAQLDAAEEALKRARANLERYRRSVLQAAFSGQLVEQNPDDEPASHTIHRAWAARKQLQPVLPFQADDLPNLSSGWCWASLEQLTNGSRYAMKAGPFGSAVKKEFYVPSGYKIYGQEQVIRGDPNYGDYYISRDLFEKLQSCEVKPGDVLVSLVGTIGKVLILPNNIEPGIINPRLVKLSFDYRIIDSRYFKYYLESQAARDYFSIASHGQTMDVLNLGILKGLPIPLPPINEQKRIVMEIERFETLAESQNNVVDKSLGRISRLQQSILEKAFIGRLVDQNPDDEPTSVLLQRIQAEREEREKQQVAKPKKEKKKMTEEKKRKPLAETLHAAGTRLTPEDLFRRAGFDEESVDEFYEELRQELQVEIGGKVVKSGRIKEERPSQAYIYLSEVRS